MRKILRYIWGIICAIGRFLDSPEIPTERSKRNEDYLLYFIIVLIGAIFAIGFMLVLTAPGQMPR